MRSLRWISYNDLGEHFFERSDGSTICLPKATMADGEMRRVYPELHMPAYDPFWSYDWYVKGKELQQRHWVETLSPEERLVILKNAESSVVG